jgi:hypothetical protein
MVRTTCAVLAALFILGCAESFEAIKPTEAPHPLQEYQKSDFSRATAAAGGVFPAAQPVSEALSGAYRSQGDKQALLSSEGKPPSTDSALPEDVVARKIIYTANVQLIVENFDDGEKKLRDLIQKHQGRIANSDTQGTSGAQRSGHWKVRIPVEKFEGFKLEAEKIGNLERSSIDSKDVTEEYYDVEARIKNKKVEETRLINHLEKTTGKLSDILEVERELSRVRGEIEQMQGRLKMLTNLSSLTTVDVFIREVKNYVPPTAPTYGDEVNRRFSSSWTGLVATGKSVSLKLVGAIPWLPIWLVIGLVLYVPVRKLWRWLRMKLENMPVSYQTKPAVETMQ